MGFGFITACTVRRGSDLRRDNEFISDMFGVRCLDTFKLWNQRGSWVPVTGALGWEYNL